MSDTFRDREKGYEAKYKHDQELEFKATARRDKLFGLWVAVKMGYGEGEAKTYAMEIVSLELDKPGSQAVIEKVTSDLAENNIQITDKELRAEMDRFYAIALSQLYSEFPEALETDHENVG